MLFTVEQKLVTTSYWHESKIRAIYSHILMLSIVGD